ncbi:MAG: arginine--tRNA ligase [Alphaproteobacteria bacterium]|jgi:arginyl-tRNA synthetase|nr:arginine--tRNA ligase [Alphaproteobacteria bacterium]MBP9878192.1 arginine--tRNA ligase [Alphaproteobacteria bacterium]
MSHLFEKIEQKIQDLLVDLIRDQKLPEGLDFSKLVVELPRDKSHGDMASNAAMVLAKEAKMPPRALAELVVEKMRAWDFVESIEIAGPGFINMRFSDAFWLVEFNDILKAGSRYGAHSARLNETINIEFISANPTGPLHAAHARGAVIGDVLASLLEFSGYKVIREYLINDTGGQIDTLARSLHLRYREALGEKEIVIPQGLYPGAYVCDVASQLVKAHGDFYLNKPESEWLEPLGKFAVESIMIDVKKDIEHLGIQMDVFTSERTLLESGAVQKAFDVLESHGLTYVGTLEPPKGEVIEDWEPRPQVLFKATQFGDDIDRAFKKSDGTWTYFAKDIAYHFDKYSRGAKHLINVFGADHAGYIKRIKAATKAVSMGEADLDVKICQLVHLYENGQAVKMSKRAGTFVTVEDVIDKVGKDVLRFIMLSRRNDQTLDFDFAEVTKQSKENPVFYVQYAYARCQSVFRHAIELFGADVLDLNQLISLSKGSMNEPEMLDLVKLLAYWPKMVEGASKAHEPHRIVFYLMDLASAFHQLWHQGRENACLRFLLPEDRTATQIRLALLTAIAFVLESGFSIIGVEPRKEM